MTEVTGKVVRLKVHPSRWLLLPCTWDFGTERCYGWLCFTLEVPR